MGNLFILKENTPFNTGLNYELTVYIMSSVGNGRKSCFLLHFDILFTYIINVKRKKKTQKNSPVFWHWESNYQEGEGCDPI